MWNKNRNSSVLTYWGVFYYEQVLFYMLSSGVVASDVEPVLLVGGGVLEGGVADGLIGLHMVGLFEVLYELYHDICVLSRVEVRVRRRGRRLSGRYIFRWGNLYKLRGVVVSRFFWLLKCVGVFCELLYWWRRGGESDWGVGLGSNMWRSFIGDLFFSLRARFVVSSGFGFCVEMRSSGAFIEEVCGGFGM